MILDKRISEGHYARKQLLSKDRLIAWSHRRRFQIGLKIIESLSPRKILDYGAGDGTFLALMRDREWTPEVAVGAELGQLDIDECNLRYAGLSYLRFVLISDLSTPEHCGAYDVVVCMEVLEHVTDLPPIIHQLHRSLATGGHLVISVPVEIGPPITAKQTLRRIAGWRNLGDYKYNSRYTLRELWKSVLAGETQHIERPVYSRADGSTFHDHKGFNWRVLKKELDFDFAIDTVINSPIPHLGPSFASQVWLVGRKR